MLHFIVVTTALLLGITPTLLGCSVYMSASRSTYKDTSVIKVGADRSVILKELGPSHASLRLENGGYKDIYKIDPDAHRTGSKGAAVAWHVIADIFTIGLWEIVGTPLELAAQDKPVTFILKFDDKEKLVEMETVK